MEDRLLTKMAALLEEARAEGAAAGREMARHELIEMLSQSPKKNGHAPRTRTRAARPVPPPEAPLPLPEPEPPHAPSEAMLTSLISTISQALVRMPQAEDGVDPDGLTQFIKQHQTNGDIDVSVRDVRGALRQMTMTGEVRRIARGRYIVGQVPPPGLFTGSTA